MMSHYQSAGVTSLLPLIETELERRRSAKLLSGDQQHAADRFLATYRREADERDGGVVAHRVMRVGDRWGATLQHGTAVGRYWSWKKSAANDYDAAGGKHRVRMTALLPFDSIDVEEMVAANVDRPTWLEREVPIRPGAPIKLLSVEEASGNVYDGTPVETKAPLPLPVTASEPRGRCFSWAYRYLLRNVDQDDSLRLVHAMVEKDGRRFWHAWVEDGVTVWQEDVEHPQDRDGLSFQQDIFYEVTKPTDIRRFTEEQAHIALLRSGHQGPWDEVRSPVRPRRR